MLKIMRTKGTLNLVMNHLIYYPTPINIHLAWNFGFLSGIFLGVQLLSGILLAMHYTPHVDYAFSSVEHIMRDVNDGWILRYMHSNGASFFFIVVWIHIFRGFFYESGATRPFVWLTGFIIFFLMIATAFMGYVLPWGQMSFWGATVITNLLTAIPVVGQEITLWLWGGFSVDNPTLNRFFSLHFLMPFVIAAVALAHLHFLHLAGSSNAIMAEKTVDKIVFTPYFLLKDLKGILLVGGFFAFIIFFYPNVLGHPDNYIPANSLVTPEKLVPEWYFLPYYAILRSVPNKLGGLAAMFAAIILFAAPIYSKSYFVRYGGFFVDVLIWLNLTHWGHMPAMSPYVDIVQNQILLTTLLLTTFVSIITVVHITVDNSKK